MLDVVTFILACIPIVFGFILVFCAFKERWRVAVVPKKVADPATADTSRCRPFALETAKRLSCGVPGVGHIGRVL
jgi:hypothetical protein